MNPSKQIPIFDDLLFHVAEGTLGELAFMLVTPREAEPIEPQGPVEWGYVAGVEFTGPFGGRVFAAVTKEMLEPLAANMLGIEPGESPPDGVKFEDALKELLNVVCGNLLPAIAGDEVIFHIGGPEMLAEPTLPDAVPGCVSAGMKQLDLDSGTAALALFIDENADVPEAAKES